MIREYRRKDIVKAVQYDGKNLQEILDFSGGRIRDSGISEYLVTESGNAHRLDRGVWIVLNDDGFIESATNGAFQQLFEEVA